VLPSNISVEQQLRLLIGNNYYASQKSHYGFIMALKGCPICLYIFGPLEIPLISSLVTNGYYSEHYNKICIPPKHEDIPIWSPHSIIPII